MTEPWWSLVISPGAAPLSPKASWRLLQCGRVLSHVLVLFGEEDGVWVNADYSWPCSAVHTKSPPLGIVRRFIHLLEQSQHDFWEESEVLRLQEEVVKRIRASRQLESDLDLMDIKIGLLVKNRITLQVEREGTWLPPAVLPSSIAAWTRLCFTS